MAKKRASKKQSVLEQAGEMQVVRKGSRATRMNRCGDLMRNEEEWDMLLEAASQGCSLSTLEAMVGLREGTLKVWLDKGKDEKQKVYHSFRKTLLKHASQARRLAEGIMLQKNPEKWLEKNSAARAMEEQVVSGSSEESKGGGLVIAEKLVEAMSVLLAQGYSVEDVARDRGMLLEGQVVGRKEEEDLGE